MNADVPLQILDVRDFSLSAGKTVIEASAGTGKTFTIQYLVLDLLCKKIELPDILIVTFTEMATKELRERIQHFLTEVHASLSVVDAVPEPLQSVLQKWIAQHGKEGLRIILRKALLRIDEISIYTIHGFCQRTLQENVFGANTDYAQEVCKDKRSVLEELVRDFLRKINFTGQLSLPQSFSFFSLVQRAGKLTVFKSIAGEVIDDVALVEAPLLQAMEKIKAYAPAREELLKEIYALEGKVNGQFYGQNFYSVLQDTLSQFLSDPQALGEKEMKKFSATEVLKKVNKAHRGTVELSSFFYEVDQFCSAQENYDTRMQRLFDASIIRSYQEWKERNGQITFDDMIIDLHRALRKSPGFVRSLQSRYQALLVDEFQDTDERQYEIFDLVFGGEHERGNRYFAMIGDPKQSIYRFRGADINVYRHARAQADFFYTLGTNYRSEPELIAGVNEFFREENFAVEESSYEPILFQPVSAPVSFTRRRLAFSSASQKAGLWQRMVSLADQSLKKTVISETISATVEDVAQLIASAEAGHVFFVAETDGQTRVEKLKPSDVAILVDEHQQAEDIVRGLGKKGILAIRKSKQSIFQSPEAKDVLLFLRACVEPSSRGINSLLLTRLFDKSPLQVRELPDDERQFYYDTLATCGTVWEKGHAVSKAFFSFMDTVNLRQSLLQRTDGERILTNVLHLMELLQNEEKETSLRPAQVIQLLIRKIQSAQADKENEQSLMRLESDAEAVTVMTLHASKGLEFPVVFLPTLWSRAGKGENETRLYAMEKDKDVFAEERIPPHEAAEQVCEVKRLGYVAMTRAVHLCVYYDVCDYRSPSGNSSFSSGWFASWFADKTIAQRKMSEERLVIEGEKSVAFEKEVPPAQYPRYFPRGLADDYRITSYSALHRQQQEEGKAHDPFDVLDESELSVQDSQSSLHDSSLQNDLLLQNFIGGTRTGTCLHELLEICDFTQPAEWEAKIDFVLSRFFSSESEEKKAAKKADLENLLRSLVKHPFINKTQENGIDLSALSKKNSFAELDFFIPVQKINLFALEAVLHSWAKRIGLSYEKSVVDERQIHGFLHGSIDLFFEQTGRFYILDWKTNQPPRGSLSNRISYGQPGMHALMKEGGYYLQALLYSVASYQFLQSRLGETFVYERHIGGFIYCFVRGLGPQTGWLHQRFDENEVLAARVALGIT